MLDVQSVSRCGVFATVSRLWTKQGMKGLALWIGDKIAMQKDHLAHAKCRV